jgi:ribosomal protein S18 acetylase RimI-like enzyme
MIEISRIKDSKDSNFHSVWNIYEDSFPSDEKRTKDKQIELLKNKDYFFYALIEKNECVGFIAIWELSGYQFFEHFAIKQELRNQGRGTKVVKMLLKNNKKILVEVERPETSHIAKRRINFYKRLGFQLNKYNYVQPSYGNGKSPVKMNLMTSPSEIAEKDYYKLRNALHLKVYGLVSPVSDM